MKRSENAGSLAKQPDHRVFLDDQHAARRRLSPCRCEPTGRPGRLRRRSRPGRASRPPPLCRSGEHRELDRALLKYLTSWPVALGEDHGSPPVLHNRASFALGMQVGIDIERRVTARIGRPSLCCHQGTDCLIGTGRQRSSAHSKNVTRASATRPWCGRHDRPGPSAARHLIQLTGARPGARMRRRINHATGVLMAKATPRRPSGVWLAGIVTL